MAIVLSTIQQRVERSLYKLLEGIIAELEYGLVKADYTDDDAGLISYKANQAEIITAKGFTIELFGSSAPYSKLSKQVPRIVIIPDRILTGDIGSTPDPQYTILDEGFAVEKVAPTSSDLHYEIRTVADSIKQDRIMNAIMGYAIATRGYIKFYDADAYFFMQRINNLPFPNAAFSLIERVNLYEVKDLYEYETQQIGTVAAINTIQLKTLIQNINLDLTVEDSTKIITDPT